MLITKLKNNRKIFENFSYLFVIEIVNYILPFITIPYIVKVVGVENFGVITFSYLIMSYLQLMTNYGFHMLAIKDISINRDNNHKISKIFWRVIMGEIILFTLSLSIFFIVLNIVPDIYKYRDIFIYSLGIVIGNLLFPIWFFQGIEEMKYIAIFNFISRVLYTILIFVLIQNRGDFLYIPLLNSISLIVVGVSSILLIYFKYKIDFILPSLNSLIDYFKKGYYLFISKVLVNLYTTINTLILGLMVGYEAVGIYSLAEKIYGALIKIITITNQVLYPHLSKYANNQSLLIAKIRYVLKYYIMALISISILLYFSSEYIITLLFGDDKSSSIVILKIFSITLIFAPFGGFFTQYMVISSKSKLISRVMFLTMIFNTILVLPLIYFYHELGLVVTILLVQIYHIYINLNYNRELLKG